MAHRILKIMLACLAGGGASASLVQGAAPTPGPAQIQPYLHPQRMVAVDGRRRLNLYCVGKGEPTVLFDSGMADAIAVWRFVQPEVGKVTRACAYERAGYGFSDPPSGPSDARAAVEDIHHLLAAAKISGPIVYVGHSIAGLYGVLLEGTYPGDVAGEVLVDPSFSDQIEASIASIPPAKRRDVLPSQYAAVAQMKECAAMPAPLPKKCLGGDSDTGPKDIALAKAEQKRVSKPSYMLTNASELESFLPKGSEKSADRQEVETANAKFGDKPLVILTRDKSPASWNAGHDRLAALSQRGSNTPVPNTSHYIQVDQPKIVIDAVIKAVHDVRR
jgi:pimeloyl-ACP methyl ester carboxylesterase